MIGILTSPLLHGGLLHILSNSLPLLVLSTLLRWHGSFVFWVVTIVIMILGGLGTWLVSSAPVVGASGMIFGYWAFLIIYGFLCRSFRSLFISLLVLVFYGWYVFIFIVPASYQLGRTFLWCGCGCPCRSYCQEFDASSTDPSSLNQYHFLLVQYKVRYTRHQSVC